MNKKVNTLLFVLFATIFNIAITLLSFILLGILYLSFLMPRLPPEVDHSWVAMFIFIAAIAIAFVVYRLLFKFIAKKFDLEKYFDPIFAARRKRVY